MKIADINLSDLKAAFDFVRLDITDLVLAAKEKKVPIEKIPAYEEVKEVEHKLYHELLNRTRGLN